MTDTLTHLEELLAKALPVEPGKLAAYDELCDAAVDALPALIARQRELERALEPFGSVNIDRVFPKAKDDQTIMGLGEWLSMQGVNLGCFRTARRALANGDKA